MLWFKWSCRCFFKVRNFHNREIKDEGLRDSTSLPCCCHWEWSSHHPFSRKFSRCLLDKKKIVSYWKRWIAHPGLAFWHPIDMRVFHIPTPKFHKSSMGMACVGLTFDLQCPFCDLTLTLLWWRCMWLQWTAGMVPRGCPLYTTVTH